MGYLLIIFCVGIPLIKDGRSVEKVCTFSTNFQRFICPSLPYQHQRGCINKEHHIAFRLTSFGNENATAGESSGSAGAAASEALDEEEDELNSLLRERRRWIEERRASDTSGSVFIKEVFHGLLIRTYDLYLFVKC